MLWSVLQYKLLNLERRHNCEGKDYVQLYFHDGHFGPMGNPTNDANPFQNQEEIICLI